MVILVKWRQKLWRKVEKRKYDSELVEPKVQNLETKIVKLTVNK